MLELFLRLSALHEEVTVEFEEMDGSVDVPRLPPVPPSSLPSPLMAKKKPNYSWFVYHGRRFTETDGIIVHTAAELERSVFAAIADGRCTRGVGAKTVYPIGPVISFSPRPEQPHEYVRWLAMQAPGLGGAPLLRGRRVLNYAPQAHEIARGLERSGHHCGWNSVLESLWLGVPMTPWLLYAEQHLKAVTLVAYMGIAAAMKVVLGARGEGVDVRWRGGEEGEGEGRVPEGRGGGLLVLRCAAV
ncbi:hypothetical protein ACP4OV_029501 [Aristida adscensionis]